jgi:CubicO group peptidase (beta-lactamase class C family)
VRELERYMTILAEADLFSGAVLVAKDGRPLFAGAYGLANAAHGVPNRLDTKFNLGSMNKMFTGVAVAQLAAQGRLAFDDPLAGHVPDYPRRAAERVTLRHLLTHTAGVPDFFGNPYFAAAKDRFRSTADFLSLFRDEPLAFAPGEQWRYSNSGYILLGVVIERVSGRSYAGYVREHVHAPAGMADTDLYEADRPVANLAEGYTTSVIGHGGGVEVAERVQGLNRVAEPTFLGRPSEPSCSPQLSISQTPTRLAPRRRPATARRRSPSAVSARARGMDSWTSRRQGAVRSRSTSVFGAGRRDARRLTGRAVAWVAGCRSRVWS